MVHRIRLRYCNTVDYSLMDPLMKPVSGLRAALSALTLLALVAAATLVLVMPELIGGSAHATLGAIGAIPALGHH